MPANTFISSASKNFRLINKVFNLWLKVEQNNNELTSSGFVILKENNGIFLVYTLSRSNNVSKTFVNNETGNDVWTFLFSK